MARRLRAALWFVALGGCGEAVDDGPHDPWDVERTCIAPAGLGRPETIAEVVDLVNALPMPVSLPCFLESLDRPFGLVGATSPFSAQATRDTESPRLFLFFGDLVLTIVPVGDARVYLELGEYIEVDRTIKAEFEFPVVSPLSPWSPFERPAGAGGTTCSICHGDERFEAQLGEVSTYSSYALAPERDQVIPIGLVEQHALDCDAELDPERCALLTAVFGHGDVESAAFPPETRICLSP